MSTIVDTGVPTRRFGPDFVESHRTKFGRRPPEQRQLTYDIAVLDEYAPWRDWLDAQLDHLTSAQADAAAGKVWLDESFWTVIFELAVGAALRDRGLAVAYEAEYDRLTPDWTILDAHGRPACFVEVHTDMPGDGTFARMRAWHGLSQRIRAIPVPVVLALAPSDRPLNPPDAGTAKKIAQELKGQLLSLWQPRVPQYHSHGYTFQILGNRQHGPLASPLGLRACFEPPSGLAGFVSADRMLEGAEKKASKYRNLARSLGVPLVVAIGSHKFTGVTLATLDRALQGTGAPHFEMQFGIGDTFIAPETTVAWAPVPPWTWPADLAALMWIDTAFPFPVEPRPNPDTGVMPHVLASPLARNA